MDCLSQSWLQILSLFLANAALIMWFRAESRSDWRHMDAKVDANYKEVNQLIRAIHDEMKDFHTRLCIIEERNKK